MSKSAERRRTASRALAVIDIGSHTVRMDLFEVARDGALVILESLSRPVNLGFDVFRCGSVSPENLDLLSHVMRDFAAKLAEYRIERYRVIATSAIREAFNRELAADRIRNSSHLSLEILDSTSEIKIMYQAMRSALSRTGEFEHLRGLGLIIGAGSLFVIYFEKGLMRFCEEMPLGTIRFYDTLGRSSLAFGRLTETLESADLPARIRNCVALAPDAPVTLIGIGAAPRLLAGFARGGRPPQDLEYVELEEKAAAGALKSALKLGASGLSDALDIAPEEAGNIEVGAAILDYFINRFPCRRIIVPGVTTRSAVAEDCIRQRSGRPDRSFDADLVAVCHAIGRKYAFDADHAGEVAHLAGMLLAKLKREFDFEVGAGLLLEAAAVLHDIGRFVDTRQHHKHSGYLIANMQLPGVSAASQRVIAAAARYHRGSGPKASHSEYTALPDRDKVTVLKLAAILRVADALDCARSRRFHRMKLVRRGNQLIIRSGAADLRSEQFYLARKSGLFTQVFGLELKIEEDVL